LLQPANQLSASDPQHQAEIKISKSTHSAEYGRSSGSIVNVATRSGTNAFHGEAFDYLRNNYFDARNYLSRHSGRISRREWNGATKDGFVRFSILKWVLP